MKRIIDIETWKRKEHFRFFEKYEEPFFGITANVNCTKAYRIAKEKNLSFFLYYLYTSLKAVNGIEELRYRIENGMPVCYDVIHGSTTVMNSNELFSFAFLPFSNNFDKFYRQAVIAVDKAKQQLGLGLDEDTGRPDVIHYSTVPWVSFTSLSQERCFSKSDSIPKITFGKFFSEENTLKIPVSVHAHHGLADGLHVGRFFELFQELLDE